MDYNKNKIYKEKIKEQVDNLILTCRTEGVPCFISVAVSNKDMETEYISESITPNSLGINLHDDRISDHINVLNGFKTVPFTELYDKIKENPKEKEQLLKDWSKGVEFEEITPE